MQISGANFGFLENYSRKDFYLVDGNYYINEEIKDPYSRFSKERSIRGHLF